MTFREHQVVRLKCSRRDASIAPGAIGAIVAVYEDGEAYEVEFCDTGGVTLALLTLQEEELEAVD